ncbi:MAG: hypothetical protein O7D91_09500 [Planctomycetota bacterium]|nr:hypothetical protein [Planctomycetota bacterium]
MKPLFFSCVIGIVSFVGCHRPAAPQGPTQGTVLAASDDNFRGLWEACQAVLRRHRFEIDRKDLRAGLITTFPQTSQHFLEFWRHDVDTPYDLAESSMRTVRRSVTIQISKPQDEGEYVIDVTVNKERFHAVERQINNAAAALRVFSTDLPSTAGRKFDPATDMTWTPEGRDAAMENRLLDLIRRRCDTL